MKAGKSPDAKQRRWKKNKSHTPDLDPGIDIKISSEFGRNMVFYDPNNSVIPEKSKEKEDEDVIVKHGHTSSYGED